MRPTWPNCFRGTGPELNAQLSELGQHPAWGTRYTRLTNAHSKKFENHCHMVSLYTVWYNFVRINKAVKMAPAMAAGGSQTLWTMDDIVGLIDAAAPDPKPCGPCQKRDASQ
jgi:hypothetical protein